MSADSIVPEPGNPQALNRYSYSYNNPINFVDPSGHATMPPASCAGIPDCGLDGDDGWSPPSPPSSLPGLDAEAQSALQGLGVISAWGNGLTTIELIAYAAYLEGAHTRPSLHEAFTRKYRSNCAAGSYSQGCLEGFWGYFQGILTPSQKKFGEWSGDSIASGIARRLTMAIAVGVLNPTVNSAWSTCAVSDPCGFAFVTAADNGGDAPGSYFFHVSEILDARGRSPESRTDAQRALALEVYDIWVPDSGRIAFVLSAAQQIRQCNDGRSSGPGCSLVKPMKTTWNP